MTDIRLENGEIVLGQRDFETVSGGACGAQDVIARLTTDVGALFYDSGFGEGIQRFLHSSSLITEIKACILRALQAEPRVVANSENIIVSFDEGLEAKVSFNVYDSTEAVNLTLRLGEELEIYEV